MDSDAADAYGGLGHCYFSMRTGLANWIVGLFYRFCNDRYYDLLRLQWAAVWDVIAVAKQQLQRMVSGLQFQFGGGLCLAKMQVVGICRNGCAKCRQWGIDQQMMMAGAFILSAGRSQSVTPDTEFDRYGGADGGAVHGAYDKHLRLCCFILDGLSVHALTAGLQQGGGEKDSCQGNIIAMLHYGYPIDQEAGCYPL
jgi:hypothetical protein